MILDENLDILTKMGYNIIFCSLESFQRLFQAAKDYIKIFNNFLCVLTTWIGQRHENLRFITTLVCLASCCGDALKEAMISLANKDKRIIEQDG